MTSFLKLVGLGSLCALAIAGCGGDDDDNSNQPAAEVQLKRDLLKPGSTFRLSCGISATCHGAPNGSKANLYLGSGGDAELTADEVNLVYSNLVGVPAHAAPTMKRVAPGDPNNSFLIHKIDGTLDEIKSSCVLVSGQSNSGHPCGDLMPWGSTTPIDKAERDAIRNWIAQGAKNN